jgi:RNA polymerase sigma-70 factor (ECF subfamily)
MRKIELASETGKLWEEFGVPLRRFIARRVRNEHDAEDLLQEVFLRVHVALRRVEDRDRVRPWLYRKATNATADYYRNRGHAVRNKPLHELTEDDAGPENLNEEVRVCLEPLVDELPDRYRRALVLADLEGRTQKEVAEELGLSLSGAKSRVQRARKKLKAALLSCCRQHLGLAAQGRDLPQVLLLIAVPTPTFCVLLAAFPS